MDQVTVDAVAPAPAGDDGPGREAIQAGPDWRQRLRAATRNRPALVVLVVGLVLTLAGGYFDSRPQGVYWTHVDAVFLPPGNPVRGNVLEGDNVSLIYFAAAVDRAMNGNDQTPRLASTQATLYGTGVTRGYRVSLRNNGGQWQTNFNQPVLDVEVVDGSAAAVRSQLDALLARIDGLVTDLQRQQGTSTAQYIHVSETPATADIAYVRGSRVRAVAGSLLLGLGLTMAAVRVVGRRRAPAGRRRRPPVPA